jgi:hypothetical protein
VIGGGGGRHFGLSEGGFGTTAGGGAAKAPLPCSAAIRSRRLPALLILSRASDTDMPLLGFPRSSDPEWGESTGEGGLGFHDTVPGFGRGLLDTALLGVVLVDVEVALLSNAAILSRREPGFGFGLSDICGKMKEDDNSLTTIQADLMIHVSSEKVNYDANLLFAAVDIFIDTTLRFPLTYTQGWCAPTASDLRWPGCRGQPTDTRHVP